mmetsp:Transcript_11545/g.21638  ORF Transcript_11545/g.21638 Transcript_11545/m.21638 type:complete len:80 (+) Transcript_11545:85-324(+)
MCSLWLLLLLFYLNDQKLVVAGSIPRIAYAKPFLANSANLASSGKQASGSKCQSPFGKFCQKGTHLQTGLQWSRIPREP